MKNFILIIAFGLCLESVFAQTSNSCVSCNNNVIDTTKFSSAVGSENISTGLGSFASGLQNQALGEQSFAGGISSSATGYCSFAFGNQAQANGTNYSYAIGPYAIAGHSGAIAIGKFVKSNSYNSFVLGCGVSTTNLLINNIDHSLMIGFNSYKPTLFVGGAVGNGFTGKVGIGEVTDPQAKLHIRADTLEIASVLIEPGLPTNSAFLYLGNNSYGLKYSPTRLEFLTGGKYVFYNGNVGIGTYQPAARLHVDGDFQVGDSLNPKPIRFYGSINAEGENAVSFGQDNTVTGESAFAVGIGNVASGQASFAGGIKSEALEKYSFASGDSTKAWSRNCIALGKNVSVFGAYSFGAGENVKTTITSSMVIGSGYDVSNPLVNNVNKSLMIGFNSSKPTFFVGGAIGNDFTGKVGIGEITDPQAKLHIKGDDNEAYLLFVEPNSEAQSALFNIGTTDYGLKYSPTRLEFLTGGKYVFYDGNVGIGTYQPEAKLQIKDGDIFIEDINRGIIMKSPDGNCWRGTLDNTGNLHFVQVNCDDLQTGQPEPKPEKPSKTNIYPNPAGDRVYVSIDESLVGSVLEISDMNGKIILTQKLVNSENLIDLSDYQAGMYIFNISNESGKRLESKKVTKQ